MNLFDQLLPRPRHRRELSALLDRIDDTLKHADLRRYDGHQHAVRQPGTFAARFAQLARTLPELRARAAALATGLGCGGAGRDTRGERRQVEAELELAESMTIAAATFRHAHVELDLAFFSGADWRGDCGGECTLYSQARDHTFCDLNRRFVELEQAFWAQPCDETGSPLLREVLDVRAATLRADCRAFLDAAPSPGLVIEVLRHMDCAGVIARETPYYRHHLLKGWLTEAGEALRDWDDAMQRPFEFDVVRNAYHRLECLQAYPQSAGLAAAAAYATNPRDVLTAWRDTLVAPLVSNEMSCLYQEAAGGEKWTTAAFIYGLALAAQRREVEHVRPQATPAAAGAA
ncbi:MAG TPA: hypothetical protein VNS57_08770 [Steroidobacteraceae bacterium]|nr:hypothetical protein [Steroidobacteraceae bacterium]